MIPPSYAIRNIAKRKITSTLTILGISLVVFVFAGSLMLSNGLHETLVATGHPANVTVIRRASQTEVQSIINFDQAQVVKSAPEMSRDENGNPYLANEVYVLISLPKRATGDEANIVVRGVNDMSMALRPNVKLIEGRMWQDPGSEIIAGRSASERYQGCGIGEKVRFGARDWTVVGLFDAGGTGYESEIWCDIIQASDAFRRPVYSSLTLRLADTSQFDSFKARIENDPRLPLDVKREKDYYASQSRTISTFINVAGTVISFIFSLGAIVGAMITMYAAVANRTKEIGTLRALGFSRFSVLTVFLFEALIISLTGGLVGVAAAYFLNFLQISTTNWDTFSELAFNFRLSSSILIQALIFSLVMGLLGGFLPAVRASRLRIVESLRA
ncbi:MAG: FtsX-like permease family protein [Candidatus Zixiibacteriota bacterium]